MSNTTIIQNALKIITLKRVCMTEIGTFGIMIEEEVPRVPFCLSLELPWLNNEPSKSCIPKGEYLCKKIISPSRGEVYEVQNVPNRTHILIHKGNWTTDSLGCILVGEQFEDTLNPKADRIVTSVMSSGAAFSELFNIRLKKADTFKLCIEEV